MTPGNDDDLLLLFDDIVFILCCCCEAGMIALDTTTISIVGLSKDNMSSTDDVTDALLLMFFFPSATVQLHENALLDGRSKMMLYFLYSFCVLLLLSLQVCSDDPFKYRNDGEGENNRQCAGVHVGWSSFSDWI